MQASVLAMAPTEPTVINNFVSCVSDLIKINFIKPGFLVFVNTEKSSSQVLNLRNELLEKIHKTRTYIVQISVSDELPICDEVENFHMELWEPFTGTPVADYFVIIIENYKDFTYLARKMIRNRFWNPQAKFIILFFPLKSTDTKNLRTVEKILSCLFKYNAIKIIIGVPSIQDAQNTIIYSWKPYDPPKFCGYFNETAHNRLIVVNYCQNGNVKYKKNILKNKLPINMQGCILQILALERLPFVSKNERDANIERRIVNTMLKKFNFTVQYEIINAFRGERNKKGVWDGALKELIARKGHVLLGGIFPDFDVHEDFECSTSYLADSYTWIVPRAYYSPPWISLYIIFQKIVWFSVIAGFIMCVLVWILLGYLSEDTHYNQNLGHCFLNTWLCLLGLVTYIRPNKECLRIFFVFLNLYCVIFLTAYQTKLIEVLQNPTFQDQIDTIEELVHSHLKLGGSEELHDLFYNSTDPFDYLLNKKWINVSNMTKALHDVAVHRNFSVLCSRMELTYLSSVLPELSDSFGLNNYYAFPIDTFSVPLEIIALKGFPFMRKMSRDLNVYKQIGVTKGVKRDFKLLSERKRAKILYTSEAIKNFHVLTFQHLQGGFFALAAGLFGGIVVLLLELLSTLKFVGN
ncbi:unnamed protein product, partial [Brenthis ino]